MRTIRSLATLDRVWNCVVLLLFICMVLHMGSNRLGRTRQLVPSARRELRQRTVGHWSHRQRSPLPPPTYQNGSVAVHGYWRASAPLDGGIELYTMSHVPSTPLGVEAGDGMDSAPADHPSLALGAAYSPIPVVDITPFFDKLSRDPHGLPAPDVAFYMERPAANGGGTASCLRTRARALRTMRIFAWTVEAVVHFRADESFGSEWQTVFGRNGGNFTSAPFERDLSAAALKVGPDKHLYLQAWSERAVGGGRAQGGGRYVSVRSAWPLAPGTWHHLVGRSDGARLELFVNGERMGGTTFGGALATPPHEEHGDFTVGCGMHAAQQADACSCLIAEARLVPRSLRQSEWLWRPADAR